MSFTGGGARALPCSPPSALPCSPPTLHPVLLLVQVDVLYIDVPQPMLGGELLLWHPSDPPGVEERGQIPPAAESVVPSANLQVSFRGDARHAVLGYSLPTRGVDGAAGRRRVSLVLEQYTVEERHYPLTVQFDLLNDETRGLGG